MSLYSVVVPVYNSEHTLEELYTRLKDVFEHVMQEPFELILVDDSSRDNSFAVMERLRAQDKRVKIVQMARNFGQPAAVLCGFSIARGDFIITMDDDLQHPPEEIPKMAKVLIEQPDVDCVMGQYENRKHNAIRRLGTWVQMQFTSQMLKKDPNLELTSFRIMRRFLVETMLSTHTHLPQIGNLLVQTSNRIVNVPVHHDARKYGHSNYSFMHLVRDLLYDITTNSIIPLVIVRDIGIISFVVSILLSIWYLINYFVFGTTVEGFTTLVLLILAYNGLILLAIGIVGEYLMHVLDESKKMPTYVVRRKDVDD
ncbi:MAG: glycosyltransferase family 2 protein [Clostridiales bacterium]|nr:glycosyltransferase family 2 protein [Clostridiales bacterium]